MPELRRGLLTAKFGHSFRKQIPAHLQIQPVVLLAERLRSAVLLLRQIRLRLRRHQERTHLSQMRFRCAVRQTTAKPRMKRRLLWGMLIQLKDPTFRSTIPLLRSTPTRLVLQSTLTRMMLQGTPKRPEIGAPITLKNWRRSASHSLRVHRCSRSFQHAAKLEIAWTARG